MNTPLTTQTLNGMAWTISQSGFDSIPAVKYGALHEIKSPLILQPGPAALTDGLAALQAIIANSVSRKTVTAAK